MDSAPDASDRPRLDQPPALCPPEPKRAWSKAVAANGTRTRLVDRAGLDRETRGVPQTARSRFPVAARAKLVHTDGRGTGRHRHAPRHAILCPPWGVRPQIA